MASLQATETAVGYLSAHGVSMTGEYPYLYHHADFPDAGYDGILRPNMTICVDSFFQCLEQLECRTYINLSYEFADQATINQIRKPIRADRVEESFKRLLEINDKYKQIEITANLVMGSDLPHSQYSAFLQLVRNDMDHPRPKGTIYQSPFCHSFTSITSEPSWVPKVTAPRV
ncbi:MAG: hypothetical protein K9L66_04500 [Spirochaetaceae bacterium]|nr:hypothetical protein [Spirochaetaceae bacterium]MCF7950912.1 hypothetical protein [Spirochaetaceae bacterium]